MKKLYFALIILIAIILLQRSVSYASKAPPKAPPPPPFICEKGYERSGNSCVKCPIGYYPNITPGSCLRYFYMSKNLPYILPALSIKNPK